MFVTIYIVNLHILIIYSYSFVCIHSIEDRLEVWYDVAHVIKNGQMAYIRKEFLVRTLIYKNVDMYIYKIFTLFM